MGLKHAWLVGFCLQWTKWEADETHKDKYVHVTNISRVTCLDCCGGHEDTGAVSRAGQKLL